MRISYSKRAVSIILAFVMLVPFVPVFAAEAVSDALWVPFDDVITNNPPENIAVTGSVNNRVVEDGNGNKSLSMDVGFVSNELVASIPAELHKDNYIIHFEAGFVNKAATGGIFIKNDSIEIPLIKINEEGTFYSVDGKRCGGIPIGKKRDIAIALDTRLSTYSVYVGGRCVLYRWDMADGASLVDKFVLTTEGGSKVKSQLLIDNIRVYEGTKPVELNKKAVYNALSVEFEETDESSIPMQIYLNTDMNAKGKLGGGLSPTAKTNRIEQLFDGDNGYVEMEKLAGSDNLFIDASIQAEAKRIVLEADVRFDTIPVNTTFFYLRDNTSGSQVNISYGGISGSNIKVGTGSAALRKKQWNHLALIINLSKSTLEFHANGVKVIDNVAISKNFKSLSLWRIYIDNKATPGKIQVDNIRAYEGSEILDLGNIRVEEKSIYSDTAGKANLVGKKALLPHNNVIYTGSAKKTTNVPCIVIGDEALVSADTFIQLFGVEPVVNGNNVTVGNAVFVMNEAKMTVDGREIAIEAAPQMVDGQVMVPARAYGINVLGDKFYDDEHGMFLVGTAAIEKKNYSESNQYLYFNRYSKQELGEKLLKTLDGDIKQHPRIFADADDFARLREEVKSDPYKKEWAQKVIAKADVLVADSEDAEYDISTGRLTDITNPDKTALAHLGMAYQLTGEKKYAERAIKKAKNLCSYPDWYPPHTLGTGAASIGVALAFDWCYDAISEEDKQYIMEQSKINGLDAFREVYYGTATYNNKFWGKTDTNWGGVCNGGALSLAFAIAEYDLDYAMDTAYNALRSLEYPIYAIAPDGAWHEGPSYWSYYFSGLSAALASYESCIGEVHEGVYYKGMDGMLTFQAHFTGPVGKYNAYNDAGGSTADVPARLYIASRTGKDAIVKHYIDNLKLNLSLNDFVPDNVAQLLWYDTSMTGKEFDLTAELPVDEYFRDTEFMSMRQNWNDTDALWVSATGGISNTSHSHLDSGSFVLSLNGILWATELGTEDAYYSRDGKNYALNAGYTNWHYYRRKAEGHNMVVINLDNEHEIDKNVHSSFNPMVSGKGRAYTSIDLTETYGKSKVNNYLRGYMVSDGRRAFTVRDEIDLATANSDLHWYMNTDGDIVVLDNKTAVINQNGQQLLVQFAVDGDNVSDVTLKSVPKKSILNLGFNETDNKGNKIDLNFKASGKVNITAKMSIRMEAPGQTPPDTTPIAQWTVAGDDTVATKDTIRTCDAKLRNFKVNGSDFYGFKPDIYSYNIYISEGNPLPEFTLEGDGKTEIMKYSQSDGTTIFELRAYDDSGIYFTPYMATVRYSKNLDLSGYSNHQVISAEVSSEQTTATTSQNNLRYGSYDGDMSTRWSALGKGEWIVHDFGKVVDVDAFAIAFNQGNARTYTFDMLVSEDGINFTEVIKGMNNSGETNDPEVYKLDQTYKARYIKFVGYGSNANEWNNVVELITLKKK